MAINIFLDTNVLIDLFDPLRPEHINAKKLFSEIESHQYTGFVSESVLSVSVYILGKQFSSAEIRVIIAELLSLIDILPCTKKIFLDGLMLPGNDIENAVLYQLSSDNNLDYFITENKKDFKKFLQPSLPVISIKEFLNINE
jgi:predicted nucleic acid-binding protein